MPATSSIKSMMPASLEEQFILLLQSFVCLKQPTLFIHSLLTFAPNKFHFQLPNYHQSTDKMKFTIVAAIAAFVAPIAAGPAASAPAEAFAMQKRATIAIPKSKGTVTYKQPQQISGVFDGGLKTYGRGVSCTGQAEGGDKDAVFIIANGGTLKNAIIGKGRQHSAQGSNHTLTIHRPD